MTIALVREAVDDGSIPVRKLKNNQVAVITDWGGAPGYVGVIVKRNASALFSITGRSWWSTSPTGDENRVKVLPNGTELVISDNE